MEDEGRAIERRSIGRVQWRRYTGLLFGQHIRFGAQPRLDPETHREYNLPVHNVQNVMPGVSRPRFISHILPLK